LDGSADAGSLVGRVGRSIEWIGPNGRKVARRSVSVVYTLATFTLSLRETYIPRQISDNESTSVRCGGSKLLEPLLEYTRDDGTLVSMSVQLGNRLLGLIMRREYKVG
jgi:hypothetical protein